jgi:phospholipase/carboxylesterase
MALNLIHRVRVPDGAGAERRPAVVMVHGWLGNEKVMSVFERLLPPQVVMVSPRAPVEVGTESYGWFRGLTDDAGFAAGLADLRAFVEALPEAYPVDPAQVVLMGFSQGAAMSLGLVLSRPQLVKGVAVLAGFVPQQAARWATPGRLSGKPIFIAHGRTDATVSVEQARAAQTLLTQAGATVSYHEYDVGHKLNSAGMQALKAWLEDLTPSPGAARGESR